MLEDLPSVAVIQQRLNLTFPEGTGNRNYLTREMAAKTVFVMLYAGAVEGRSYWLRQDQVTRMSDAQSQLQRDAERRKWSEDSLKPTRGEVPGRWFAANTREPIRDETLRYGLVQVGAELERTDLPTTSPRGRYALQRQFALLFEPKLSGDRLLSHVRSWQEGHMSRGALTRVALDRAGAAALSSRILITFPNGETRWMEPGPSSVVSKAVVEEFAPRFLAAPSIVWLSESRSQVIASDEALARDIGLRLQSDRLLPDMIIVDLGEGEPLVVFVEVVATAGPVSEARQAALMQIAAEGGYRGGDVAFLTAYADRANAAFRSTVSELAWNSFAWFASEPDNIVCLYGGAEGTQAGLRLLMSSSL